MTKRSAVRSVILGSCLLFAGVVIAQRPETNIDAHRHPNLAEAQHHLLQASEKIDQAQNANHERLGGHAEKAKQLIDQASRELKEAAEYANQRH